MTTFGVDPHELSAMAGVIRQGADDTRNLQQHMGPVRGRALDGGHPVFAEAAIDFADKWNWGLETLVGNVDMLADVLVRVAEAYQSSDEKLADAFQAWEQA
jgi:uncharacterized protein YukE